MLDISLTYQERLQDVLKPAGFSYEHLCREFKAEYGITPNQYRTRQKIVRAKELLRDPETRVKTLAAELGFPSASRFIQVFTQYEGCTPGKYRQRI